MPNAPLRPCTAPGCPNRVAGGRCDTHKRHHRAQRGTMSELYGPDWPTVRMAFLERHPRCALCPRQARIPDHWPVPLRRLLERGIANPHHDRYLRPLCWPCHSKATARHQPAGWYGQRL